MRIDTTKIRELRQIMEDAVADGSECGCQLAVYDHGELVADLAAGFTAPDRKTPLLQNQVMPVFSVGKGMVATILHQLVQEGKLDYDTPVAEVWPEFGCRGKEQIRLRQVLAHRSGLYELPPYKELSELADWPLMCARMAEMEPETAPGTVCRYQSITFAWLAGEIACRVTGQAFPELVQRRISRPLELEDDLFFGLPEDVEKERFVLLDSSRLPRGTRYFLNEFIQTPEIRRGCVPSANGIMNARAIARHYAALLGPVAGVQLLRPETLDQATTLCRAPDDPIAPGDWAVFGLGYVLPETETGRGPVFGHGGACGAEGLADRRSGIAYGFTRNRIQLNNPGFPIRNRLRRALGFPEFPL